MVAAAAVDKLDEKFLLRTQYISARKMVVNGKAQQQIGTGP